MKNLFLLLISLGITFNLLAQLPQAFKWQGVVRNDQMEVLANQAVNMRFSILQDYENGSTIYSETHSANTNELGLITLNLGKGNTLIGDFTAIPWNNKAHFLKVEMDETDGQNYQLVGTSELFVNTGQSGMMSGEIWKTKGDSVLYSESSKFGLGVSNPSKEAHILGSLNIQDKYGTPHRAIYFSDKNNENRVQLSHSYRPEIGVFNLDIISPTNTADLRFRFFRKANTTGVKRIQFLRGNNTTQRSAEIGVDGVNSFFQTHGGNFGIGTGSPSEKLVVGNDIGNVTGAKSAIVIGEKNKDSFSRLVMGRNKINWGSMYFVNKTNTLVFDINANGKRKNILFLKPNGKVGIGTSNPKEALDVNGTTRTKILEITGGSDLSESFDITSNNKIVSNSLAGLLVSIDPKNPGKLAITSQAYDKKLAGIVSGANGIKPGMIMGQHASIANGQFPIALSGRVYVKADATFGAIQPGDFLTSSSISGIAMKAAGFQKAQGAIIGKAMTGLERGEGMVLVLVNLQ